MRGRVCLLLLATLLLADCTARNASGNAQGGVVNAALPADAQLSAAEAHCSRFKKKARLGITLETGSITFDCIP